MDYTELVRELNTELYERFGEVEKEFETQFSKYGKIKQRG